MLLEVALQIGCEAAIEIAVLFRDEDVDAIGESIWDVHVVFLLFI